MKSEIILEELGNLVEIKGGKRLPKGTKLSKEKTNHPYIRVKDMHGQKNLRITPDFEYVTEDVFNAIKKYTVSKNDIILSIVGTIGLVSKISESLDGANLTENCVKLINFKNIDEDYLYYYLSSEIGQHEIYKGIVGSTQPKLPIYNIKKVKVPMREIKEQKAIANILSTLDEKIETNNQINEKLEEMAQALFKHWFVDFEFPNENGDPYKSSGGEMVESELGMIPKGWSITSFRSFISNILGGDWGKDKEQGNYIRSIYCLRGADIPEVSRGKIGNLPMRYILEKNYNNKKLTPGTLVVEISGGSPTQSTGRITYINNILLDRFDKGLVCTNFCRALTLRNRSYMYFVYYYWKMLYNSNVFFQYENGTTGIKNLDINSFLDTFMIVSPSETILKRFNSVISTFVNRIQMSGNENIKLSQIRDSLLPKLMSGEIRVPLDNETLAEQS
jgi:type I restriction enzyme, S subunit